MNGNSMKASQIRFSLTALSVLAFGWFGWSLYDFFNHRNDYLSPKSMKAVDEWLKKEAPAKAAKQVQRRPFDEYKDMTGLNVTGKITVVPKGPEEGPKATPQQALANVLRVLYIQFVPDAPQEGRGYVAYLDSQIVLPTPSKEAFLKVGDHLPAPYAKWQVESVGSDRLVFKLEGEEKKEELKVAEFDIRKVLENLFAAAGGRGPGSRTAIAGTGFAGYPENYAVPDATKEARPGEFWISYQDAERFQKDYQSVLRDVQSSRYYDRKLGKHTGIQLNSVPGSIASQYGVKAGDVIKSINGNPVTSKEEAINWIKKNPDLPQYVVEIDQQGKIVTKTYVPPPKKK